ncbi:hypothetical protein I7I50_00317 [Histoplasma capsulatum G186AR]|uniref:Uncharacterized protein n=1 Tax=Ajellomyces capsulatus TaxID=5037 RepID=A0A8H7YIU6_AJECA|nr:hypothetical protein I7I52_07585 [Histoplasma capsulatum]QSS72463.1 hypothetical protein I7I50_00317 [Histoplasma capsulatum G186AR]
MIVLSRRVGRKPKSMCEVKTSNSRRLSNFLLFWPAGHSSRGYFDVPFFVTRMNNGVQRAAKRLGPSNAAGTSSTLHNSISRRT